MSVLIVQSTHAYDLYDNSIKANGNSRHHTLTLHSAPPHPPTLCTPIPPRAKPHALTPHRPSCSNVPSLSSAL